LDFRGSIKHRNTSLQGEGTDSIFRVADATQYRKWVAQFDTFTAYDRDEFIKALASCCVKPRIGILPLALDDYSGKKLQKFECDLRDQIYNDLKVITQGLVSPPDHFSARSLLDAAAEADYVMPLPIDAKLRPQALAAFVLALSVEPDTEIIYADEDLLKHGMRSQPYFKTDWDPYLILGQNYTGVPILFKSALLKRAKLENVSSSTADNLIHAVSLRAARASSPEKIAHIPSILCHRQSASDWSLDEAATIASDDETLPKNVTISVDESLAFGNRVRFSFPEPNPSVSILIPSRDQSEVLGRCMDGLLKQTDYTSFEIIIIDNGTTEPAALDMFAAWKSLSKVRIIHDDRPFNYSRLNNIAAQNAQGDILVLLNNDIEILHSDWLKELVSLASQSDVGIVGAKLLYPDFRLQHAGISFGPNDKVLHNMQLASRSDPGPHGELRLLRSVSAVTAACLAIRRDLYWQVGGLDEDFEVAFNDIDLCRRVAEKGYAIVWTPFAELIHHECLTRGPLSDPLTLDREISEQMKFWSKHPAFYEDQDPFHNPQIEFQGTAVEFSRPPRSHRFRDFTSERKRKPFIY